MFYCVLAEFEFELASYIKLSSNNKADKTLAGQTTTSVKCRQWDISQVENIHVFLCSSLYAQNGFIVYTN